MGVRQYGLEFRAHARTDFLRPRSPFESQLRMPTRELLVGEQVREAASKCQHRTVGFFGANKRLLERANRLETLRRQKRSRCAATSVLKQGQVGHCLPQGRGSKRVPSVQPEICICCPELIETVIPSGTSVAICKSRDSAAPLYRPPQNPKHAAVKAALPRLRTILDPPVFSTAAQGAVNKSMPVGTSEPPADPQDLVARALTILQEKTPPKHQSTDSLIRRQILSDGSECPLPIRYFDAQYLAATFLTDFCRASELLTGTGLQPLRQEDGQAVVVLFCGEYRDTDIGSYNEVGLSILSVAPGDPMPAIFVTNLPVTSSRANRAGREIWGFNKFVAEIDIRREAKRFVTTVCDFENALIGTFEGTFGPSIPTPPTNLSTFSMLSGRLLRTQSQVTTPLQVGKGDSFVLKVGVAAHPMVANLRTLGLDGKNPVLVEYADPAQALLFPGTAI